MPLEIVSSQSDTELAEREARAVAVWELRELTTNLLRVAAGAGRPAYVTGQVLATLKAFQEYQSKTGRYPDPDLIAEAVNYTDDSYVPADVHAERYYAERRIVQHSLRVAAAEMLGQRTQATTAMHGVYDGINSIEREREKERAKWRTPAATKRALQAALIGASRKTPKKKR